MNKFNHKQLEYLLQSAIQAPSADNQHLVRFQVTGDSIQVHHTESELPPEGSYKWVLALLSLGALSENLTIAASRFNLELEIILLPDPTQPGFVIEARLQPGQVPIDTLWQAIPLRHTNRQLRYHGAGLSAVERDELDKAASVYPASQLVWLEDTLRCKALHLMRLAETERFHNQLLHAELFSAIRFEVGWNQSSQVGLPPGALGVEKPLRPLFAALRHWPVMRIANLFGAHYMLGFRACYLPCWLAPQLCALTVRKIDSQSVFDTGRAFQRLWLSATRQGRVLQPMPASALYALDGVQTEGIPIALQRNLQAGWRGILGKDTVPLMLFRMGKARPSIVEAGRNMAICHIEAGE